jgi:hypothetical protein
MSGFVMRNFGRVVSREAAEANELSECGGSLGGVRWDDGRGHSQRCVKEAQLRLG